MNMNPFSQFGGLINQGQIDRMKAVRKLENELKPVADSFKAHDERYEIIARPYERRAILEETWEFGANVNDLNVRIRAIDRHGNPLLLTRVWRTNGWGKNKTLARNQMEASVKFKTTGVLRTRLKAQTVGSEPSIIFFSAEPAFEL